MRADAENHSRYIAHTTSTTFKHHTPSQSEMSRKETAQPHSCQPSASRAKKEVACPKCCRGTLESHQRLRHSGNVCSRHAAASAATPKQFCYSLLRQPLSMAGHPNKHSTDAMNRSRDLVDALFELVCVCKQLLEMVAVARVFGFSNLAFQSFCNSPCTPDFCTRTR
jgi:hypothetical protein